MRKELRRGDYASLNLYFVSGLFENSPDKTLGVGKFPVDLSEKSDIFFMDGVKLELNIMPGGHPLENSTSYGHGMSATHEVGHWLGLRHPFTHPALPDGTPIGDPCHADDIDKGDHIDDTPPQSRAWFECTAHPIEYYDSCPDQKGFDSEYCAEPVTLPPYGNANSVATNRYT